MFFLPGEVRRMYWRGKSRGGGRKRVESFLRGKEREAVRRNLPPSLPPYGFRFNPKEQVVSGKGWGLRKVIRDAAGLPASPAWGSRRLGTGEGCMCSFGLNDDRVWETELVGGRELMQVSDL